MDQTNLTLPIQVTGRVDVGRMLREVQEIDNFLKQAAIREPGTPVKMPKTSKLIDEFVSSNKLNLLQNADRAKVLNFLIMVRAKAPLIHISFSVDPAPSFVQKLMTWLRSEIHPLVLLQVGLQPNIGAGCVVRGTNKYFDFSLRQHFKKQRPLLMSKLHGDIADVEVEAVDSAAPAADAETATPEQQIAEEVNAAIDAVESALPAAQSDPAPIEVKVAEEVEDD